jgi:Shedu protein SduA, C-terminal
MIGKQDILDRATEWQLRPEVVEKDYIPASIEADDLHEYFTWWDNVTSAQVKEYLECLDKATSERELQAFFESHPNLLIQDLEGGQGRWVVPQKRLGSEFVTDFVIGERHSFGFQWQAVEIENPLAPLFTMKGNPSAELTHAIRQITDWRAWIKRNQNYTSRCREAQGLELIDIDSSVRGLILIGRERNLDPTTNDRRRQLVQDLQIDIHTYDWVARGSIGRIEALERSRIEYQDG